MYNNIPTENNTSKKTEEAPPRLNEHTYNLKDLGETSLQGEPLNQYVELKKPNLLYRIRTDKSSFNDTLNKEGLKAYLETTYKIVITSAISVIPQFPFLNFLVHFPKLYSFSNVFKFISVFSFTFSFFISFSTLYVSIVLHA